MWYKEFLNIYKAGISHVFLFHFNVRDLADNHRNLDRYIHDEFILPRKFAAVAFYDISQGLRFMDKDMEREFSKITRNEADGLFNAAPSKLFPYLDLLLMNTRTVLFIDHADKLLPSGDVSSMSFEERSALIRICEWSVNRRISSSGSAIFLMADSLEDVNRDVLKSSYKIEPVIVNLPDEKERREYIEHLFCHLPPSQTTPGPDAETAAVMDPDKPVNISGEISKEPQLSSLLKDITPSVFAKMTSGLSRKSIRDIKLRAEAEGIPVSFDFIKEKKHSVLKKEFGDVLEFVYPEYGFESVGGMDKAKNYLIRNIVQPIRKGDLRRVPMGIMFCGPSGTGKTLLVYALAKASGFNCVRIDMSRILGQYVGESEKNFKKCLLGAKSQEPVIVFVDEIDTAFRRGENEDSGVSRNIFSEFLQFAGDASNRGKVIFVAATNRPDLLDPALKRAGRFDKKIPVLMPEEDERAVIFEIMVRKYKFETTITDYMPFAARTENYTGAEIETVVRKAYELANDDDSEGNTLTTEILHDAISRCRPVTRQIEFMTMLAVEECDDMDLLPERYASMKAQQP
ncbi:MAG: ATP-binding protein [Eubacteriales bacterium]|nr:ATP-binding protein [Eubacteriales bacterium]